jgi:type VI protein secretion system component VasF
MEEGTVREDVARVVHDVLRTGIKFRDKLEAKRALSLETVQSQLRARLPASGNRDPAMEYVGIPYALVCWLDEIFIGDLPWAPEWRERKLETALYRTNDRASLFWEQAERASRQMDVDALEAFLLCTYLGFRGDFLGEPDKVVERREKFESQLGLRRMGEWREMPPELAVPPTDVPELHGKERLRTLLMALGVVLSVAVFVVSFLTVLPR